MARLWTPEHGRVDTVRENGVEFLTVIMPSACNVDLGENLWLSLHSRNPDPYLFQSKRECDYPGYARQPVRRDTSTWAIDDEEGWFLRVISWFLRREPKLRITLSHSVTFPDCESPGNIARNWEARYFGIGTGEYGSHSMLMFSGKLRNTIFIGNGTSPTVSGIVIPSE